MSSQDRSSQVRLGQVRTGQVRTGQVRLGQRRTDQSKDRDQSFLSFVSDQVVHWTIAYVYLECNMIKRKTLTWDSSVALLSPTCFPA